MNRIALILLSISAAAGSGCQVANHHAQSPRTGCTMIQRPCAETSAGCRSGCSADRNCRSRGGFGLLGKTFCDPHLSEGTAFGPWQYTYNLCLAGSQLSNTVLGGDPDESLSSRFGRAQEDGVLPVRYGLAPVTNVFVGPDHCRRCIEHDEARNKELWAW